MELNGNYVNEQSHKKGKKVCKTIGIVSLSLMIVMIVVGIILIVSSSKYGNLNMGDAGWFDDETKHDGLMFGGIACISFGFVLFGGLSVSMFVTAHQRDLLAFQASTVLPVAGEVVEQSAPVVGNALGTIVKSVKDAIVEPKTVANEKPVTKKVCAECGMENTARSKYCKNCGKELAQKRYCKNCGDEITTGENFCEKCGTKVEG